MTRRLRIADAISPLLTLAAAVLLLFGAVGAVAQEKRSGETPPPEARQADDKSDGEEPDEKPDDKAPGDKQSGDKPADPPKTQDGEDKPEEPKPEEPKDDEPRRGGRRGSGQRSLRYERENERRHASVLSAFREVVSEAAKATASVFSGGKQIALGAIVDPHGLVLTKASELGESSISCKLNDGRVVNAEIVGVDPATDLAMLKIDADNLVAVVWREGDAPRVGSWLATTGGSSLPAAVGVVSVEPRQIAQTSGMLGVAPEDSDDGPLISRVYAGSGAEKAGLRVNDVITRLNGRLLRNREALFRGLSRMKAGQTVKLTVKRGDKEFEIEATLTSRDNEQDTLGSELSERRGGFNSAIQHDTVLNADQCGGPVVDLDGKAVGINIARAGRVVSYALPVATILDVLESGKLTPASSPNPRLLELDKELASLRTSEQSLKSKIEGLRASLEKTLAGLDQARRDAAAAQQALKKAEAEAASVEKAVKSVEEELAKAQAQIDKLTSEKTSLSGDGQR